MYRTRMRSSLCCPITSYYREAMSEEVMVNDVKRHSDDPDANSQMYTRSFFAVGDVLSQIQ